MDSESEQTLTTAAKDKWSDLWLRLRSLVHELGFIGFVLLSITAVVFVFIDGFGAAWPYAALAVGSLLAGGFAALPVGELEPWTEPEPRDHAQLPSKDSPGRYYGDSAVVENINAAIDAANAGDLAEVKNRLRVAEVYISDFEPYDNSDAYLPMIWQSDVDDIREWCEENTPGDGHDNTGAETTLEGKNSHP